jgi:membrane protein implicated in regulation of membrane protease activity
MAAWCTEAAHPMDSPEQWSWLWLAAAAVFAIGEMTTPGSFFLAPFALGAFVAALLAFANVPVSVEWLVFVGVSVATLAALRPLSRRLDRNAVDHGVGSRRLLGRQATVLSAIPAGDEVGMVRVDREQWRAQSADGAPIEPGTLVRVADVQGTRVIVTPVDQLTPGAPAATATLVPDETRVPDGTTLPDDTLEPEAPLAPGDTPGAGADAAAAPPPGSAGPQPPTPGDGAADAPT